MGGREKVIAPFTQHSRSREEVERGSVFACVCGVCVCVCVCVCERERERERKGQHVGKLKFTFREGICLGYYCNREWNWDCDRLG